jgi:hypothetical protein
MKSNTTSTLIIAITIVISVAILGGAYRFRTKKINKISVTGMAEHHFTSDLVVWNAQFSRKSMDLKSAYHALKEDEKIIREYFKNKGLKEDEVIFSSVNTYEDIKYSYDDKGRQYSNFNGYVLSQTIKIESQDLEKIDKISREITELLDKGVQLQSYEPQYYYTKLADLKINLLAEASKDGRLRAETIAKNSGSKLGKLLQSSMGIFQITGQYMDEDYSWGGVYNTSSKNKTASITVKMEFELK